MKTPTPMTKSPRAVAREALALARQALPEYSVATSRKDYTQHQLFAILALKTFFKTDYRGVTQYLSDLADLRSDLGLAKVPHYSTLCYAAKRLLKGGPSSASSPVPPRPPSLAA
jgi:anion-transporting  ArsA/GET3 family ATPase